MLGQRSQPCGHRIVKALCLFTKVGRFFFAKGLTIDFLIVDNRPIIYQHHFLPDPDVEPNMRLNPMACSYSTKSNTDPFDSARPLSFGRSTKNGLATFAMIWVAVVCAGGVTFGQGQVVTTITGQQHEGEVFDLEKYSAGAFAFSPFGTANRIVVINDGLRRVMLNRNGVLVPFAPSRRNEIEFGISQKTYNGSIGNASAQLFTGPFNEHGHREFIIRDVAGKRRAFIQGITKITPRYCIVNTLSGGDNLKQWEMPVSTALINKEVLHNLLLKQVDPDDVNDYFDIADFFQQMGDFRRASDELLFIENKFPDQKERIEEQRIRLAQLFGRQILDESKLRRDNNQPRLAALWAQVLDSPEFSLDIQAELDEIKSAPQKLSEAIASTRQQIVDLVNSVSDLGPGQKLVADQFVEELNTELSQANINRLDAYLRVAKDASMPTGQKLALAISGWLLGSNNATENLATVESLYQVKPLVLEYLATATTPARRKEILAQLEPLEAAIPQYIDPMLKQSKPVAQQDLSNYDGSQPIEFFVEIPGPPSRPGIRRYQCLAHLPTEYDPYRKYPLVLTLPGPGQNLETNLNIWCGTHNAALSRELGQPVRNGQAARQGYIAVAVDWRNRGQREYKYTVREHRVVTEGLYQALRRFSVDTDRVFLSGHGEGGTAAYDIGLAHPEHWAGVLGFSGLFQKYVNQYNGNKHVGLPVYAVIGEKHITASRSLENSANKWLKSKLGRFINLTLIQYKGQLNRYFEEEVPEAFKWMNSLRRKWPSGPGFEFECKAMREGDTYFWFFELDGLPPQMKYDPELYDQTKFGTVLKMTGDIRRQNEFLLTPRNSQIGVNATLWLSPDFFDFENPELKIDGHGDFKGTVEASTETLLNDVLRRADTLRAYWVRMQCRRGNWSQMD
jgi:pimeloyl-ACP methyl ester carboxylesterase